MKEYNKILSDLPKITVEKGIDEAVKEISRAVSMMCQDVIDSLEITGFSAPAAAAAMRLAADGIEGAHSDEVKETAQAYYAMIKMTCEQVCIRMPGGTDGTEE